MKIRRKVENYRICCLKIEYSNADFENINKNENFFRLFFEKNRNRFSEKDDIE